MEEKKDPWYLKPLIFIAVIIVVLINIQMCNEAVDGDRSGIETTLKSHGD